LTHSTKRAPATTGVQRWLSSARSLVREPAITPLCAPPEMLQWVLTAQHGGLAPHDCGARCRSPRTPDAGAASLQLLCTSWRKSKYYARVIQDRLRAMRRGRRSGEGGEARDKGYGASVQIVSLW